MRYWDLFIAAILLDRERKKEKEREKEGRKKWLKIIATLKQSFLNRCLSCHAPCSRHVQQHILDVFFFSRFAQKFISSLSLKIHKDEENITNLI